MPKITVDTYEFTVKFKIRKDYWRIDHKNDKPTPESIEDLIQLGIETPLEDVEVKIIE